MTDQDYMSAANARVSQDGKEVVIFDQSPYGGDRMIGSCTPLEAERLAKDLQRAAREARANNQRKKKLGEY